MSSYIKLIKQKLKQKKYLWLLFAFISKFTFEIIELRVERIVQNRKIQLSNKVAKIYDMKVQSGPFEGMKLSKNQIWNDGSLGCKALGLYEQEVQDLIVNIQKSKKYPSFVNIGGGDGFFAIGSVINGLFNECLVFEILEKGRDALRNNAKLNGVSDKIKIKEDASEKILLKNIDQIRDSTILCDIEGSEYKIFSEKVLEKLYKSDIIIEIHKEFGKGNIVTNDESELYEKASKIFNVTIITTQERSLSFPDLNDLSDNDRALIVSEGRSYAGIWWHFSPKTKTD